MIIIIPIIIVIALIGGYWLINDSNKVWKDLREFENRAMYGDKNNLVNIRYQLFDYKKAWHKFHCLKMNKIFAIIDARQKWEE
jgi:hypothetical protein